MIRIDDLERALTVYGSDRLTPEQVSDLIAQVRGREERKDEGWHHAGGPVGSALIRCSLLFVRVFADRDQSERHVLVQ